MNVVATIVVMLECSKKTKVHNTLSDFLHDTFALLLVHKWKKH